MVVDDDGITVVVDTWVVVVREFQPQFTSNFMPQASLRLRAIDSLRHERSY